MTLHGPMTTLPIKTEFRTQTAFLQKRKFLFPSPTKRTRLFLGIFLAFITTAPLFSFKEEELLQYLTSQPEGSLGTFIKDFTYDKDAISLDTEWAAGGESSFYIAVHFQLAGMEEEALQMYRAAGEDSSKTVRTLARAGYLSLLIENGRWEEAASQALGFLGEGGPAEVSLLAPLYYSLFALEEYEKLREVLDLYEPVDTYHAAGTVKAEADFFRVWSSWYWEEPDWERSLVGYLSTHPYEDLPGLLYSWLGYKDPEENSAPAPLVEENLDLDTLQEEHTAFIEAKLLLGRSRYGEAFSEYRRYLSISTDLPKDGEDVKEAENATDAVELFTTHPGKEFIEAVSSSGRLSEGVRTVEAARKKLEQRKDSSTPSFRLLETEAFLKRRLGRFSEVLELYERALDIAPEEERERMRWYRYDALMHLDPSDAVEDLLELSAEWEDPDYYDDVLFDLADRLVRLRRWGEIARAADILARTSRSFAAARFAYIAARASETGLYSASDSHIAFWYSHAVKSGCGVGAANYYRIMAQERLRHFGVNKVPVKATDTVEKWWPFCGNEGIDGWREGNNENSGGTLFEDGIADKAKVLAGYLRYGLSEYAYKRFGDNLETISRFSPFIMRLWAQDLQRRNNYLDSVRLLSRYYGNNNREIQPEDTRLLYPRAYEDIMMGISGKYEYPDYLLFALVREESLFTADISSHAGAVGLSQLMPSTAEDIASRIGVRITDLTDPELNLTLGGWYLDHLIGRTDNYSQALFSYNGGITKVRRWIRDNRDLPGDLFLEALPYEETSHFGRKVLVSAVVYGYVYRDTSIAEIVESFFGENTEYKEKS
ncbi:MAG: flagellar assembly lytic transglycosylase [Spirochaetaceae bacterium]